MNLFEKIQAIRVDLKKEDIKMTGRNDFANYDYFELDDFLTPLNDLMQKYKMTAIPAFTNEQATLTAVNIEKPEEQFTITSPFGTAQLKGCHEVQNIGAVETYQRRYLYQALFDIAESDALNKTQGNSATPETSKTSTTSPQKNQTSQETPKNEQKIKCSECNSEVTEKVAKYSKDKYGKVLCFDCQKKNKIEDGDLPF